MVGFVPDYAIAVAGKERFCFWSKAELLDCWFSYTGICCAKVTPEYRLIALLDHYISIH